MVYRKYGKTGVDVSALGFGCMRLPKAEDGGADEEKMVSLLRRAYDEGINYYDTAWGYSNGKSEAVLGRALESVRDKVRYATKLPEWVMKEPGDFWKLLMESIERLRTGYIDFYHLHALDKANWKTVLDMGLMKKAEKALSMGLIKYLSFSFHDEPALMKEIIDTGAFSGVLVQYNLVDDTNAEMMEYAADKGLGVAVMGPLGGGSLLAGGDALVKKFDSDAASAAELALRYVWGNRNVSVVLSGMNSDEQLTDNLRYAEASGGIQADEIIKIKNKSDELKKLSDLYCTACGYCEICPEGVKPAFTFDAYNMLNVWGLKEIARARYNEFAEYPWHGAHPDKCAGCGECAKRCPQKIDIPAELKRASAALSQL